jgi:hypothetical protein
MFRCGGEKEAQDGTAAETKKISPTGNPDVWETLWGLMLFGFVVYWRENFTQPHGSWGIAKFSTSLAILTGVMLKR